ESAEPHGLRGGAAGGSSGLRRPAGRRTSDGRTTTAPARRRRSSGGVTYSGRLRHDRNGVEVHYTWVRGPHGPAGDAGRRRGHGCAGRRSAGGGRGERG